MRLAKPTTTNFFLILILFLSSHYTVKAQENSPYSRYGLGDVVPNRNIFSRGMGGITAGVFDLQSINFTNPASLGSIPVTIFDVSAEADVRTLKSTNPPDKFTQANSLFSYLQLGFPLTSKKMAKKGISWGMNFGIRPVTRIGYKIEKRERLTGIDSLYTLYEGDGGANQVLLGTGIKYRNISFGLTAGYMFGSKSYSTKLEFINDSVVYYKSNYSNKTTFGGIFLNAGLQVEQRVGPGLLRVGLYGGIRQNLKASRDEIKETFAYDGTGATYRLDSVYEQKDIKGTIRYPSTVGAGFTYTAKHWIYGIDVETANWSNYTYYGKNDLLHNSFTVRAGVQYYPLKENTPIKKYLNFIKYRAGAYYGSDYVEVNKTRPEYGFTVGAGMPLTSLQRLTYNGEYVLLNIGVEFGNRGNKQTNIRENTMRYSIGVSMNARWFQKPKYN